MWESVTRHDGHEDHHDRAGGDGHGGRRSCSLRCPRRRLRAWPKRPWGSWGCVVIIIIIIIIIIIMIIIIIIMMIIIIVSTKIMLMIGW
jgi:hypothetical protein